MQSLGQLGVVLKVMPSDDVRLATGGRKWTMNPLCLLPAPGEAPPLIADGMLIMTFDCFKINIFVYHLFNYQNLVDIDCLLPAPCFAMLLVMQHRFSIIILLGQTNKTFFFFCIDLCQLLLMHHK